MERFSVVTIAYVTGYTCSTVASWANLNNKSVKDGLTVPEIMDFLQAPEKSREYVKVDKYAAIRLRTALEVMGTINRPFELGV